MKNGYGQFCPLAKAAELLCERWTMIIIRELIAGSQRFNDLRRGVPLISPTLLSRRLRQLVDANVVQRVSASDGSPSYSLTQAGEELRQMVEFMGSWGHRWIGSQLSEDDLDVGLLMWDIRRGVDSTKFPPEQVVLQINFTDAPEGQAEWWLVSEKGETDLCLEDPGFEVDLVLQCSVRTLTSIWLCRNTIAQAERSRELKIMGDDNLRKQLPQWLQGSPLARLGEQSMSDSPGA